MADEDPPIAPADAPAKPTTDGAQPIQARIEDIANRWLEDRFGLKVGETGLHLPDTESLKDFGTRAEQFVRSFFKGFLDKTPDELGGLPDMPSAVELATRLLAKTTGTVSNAFNDYLRENAVAATPQGEPVVIDGRFLVRHGAPLLGRLIQALGGAFAEDVKAEHIPEPTPKVDVKVDVPQVFKSLLGRPTSEAPSANDDPQEPT